MTETDARQWLIDTYSVSRETLEQLATFVRLLLDENQNQNLIASSTEPHVWFRHIVDSAQLGFSPRSREWKNDSVWYDVGSGAGLPGIVLAILNRSLSFKLVEPRKGRVSFLNRVVEQLELSNVEVVPRTVARARPKKVADIISARAYAPLLRILESCVHLADCTTTWILPKGRQWKNEMELVSKAWHYKFHVEHSVTDPASAILVLTEVANKRLR